jgi:hypothetical protein
MKEKQPKVNRIEDAAGLRLGDYVEDSGYIWRVTAVEGLAVNCRRLNWLERVRLGFAQWRKRRKEKNADRNDKKNPLAD